MKGLIGLAIGGFLGWFVGYSWVMVRFRTLYEGTPMNSLDALLALVRINLAPWHPETLLITAVGAIIGLMVGLLEERKPKTIAESLLRKNTDKPTEPAQEQEDPIDATDRHGWTRLHNAAMSGDLVRVRELIEAGADINAREKLEGWTPLKVAQVHKNDEVALFLKEHGGV